MTYEVKWYDRYNQEKIITSIEAKGIEDLLHKLEEVAFDHGCGTLYFFVQNVKSEEGQYPALFGSLDSLLKRGFHDEAIKDSSIELDFDGSDADAQKLAKQFGCDVKHTGSANGYPTYRFSGPRDKLKRLAKKYGMDAEDFEEFVEDSKTVKDASTGKYVIYSQKEKAYLGYGARSWLPKGHEHLDRFDTEEEAEKYMKESVYAKYRPMVVKDEAINDALVEPSKELINNVKQRLDKAGFIAEFKGFTGSGRAEFYIMSKEHSFIASDRDALNVLGSELEDVCDFCEKAKSPATFNISYNPSKHAITGYFHVDKTYVKDAATKDAVLPPEVQNAIKRGKLRTDFYNGMYAMRIRKSDAERYTKELEAAGYKVFGFQSNPYVSYNFFFKDSKPKIDAKKLTEIVSIAKMVPTKDAPDMETKSGAKEVYFQRMMAALKDIDYHLWNRSGDKVTLNNNEVIMIATPEGVIIKNEKGFNKTVLTTDQIIGYIKQLVHIH